MSLAEKRLVAITGVWDDGDRSRWGWAICFVDLMPFRCSFRWPCAVSIERGGFWRIIFGVMPCIAMYALENAARRAASVGDPNEALAYAVFSACVLLEMIEFVAAVQGSGTVFFCCWFLESMMGSDHNRLCSGFGAWRMGRPVGSKMVAPVSFSKIACFVEQIS